MSRAARQLLRDLHLAGLSHVPRSEKPVLIPVTPEPVLPEVMPAEPDVPEEPVAREKTPLPSRRASPSPVPSSQSALTPRSQPLIGLPREGRHSAPNQVLSTASLEERQTRLQELATCVAGCTRCPQLATTRTQTVFGVGNPQAKIMFIGEAPGADEDRTGIPFVGPAGQLLTKIIEACNWKRDDLYICNVLRCRPPGNRTPNEEEANNCREYLDGQIAAVDPEYIVCWGACAAQNLLGVKDSIGKMRQRFYEYGRAKVLCTYHPSYLLRNPAAKKPVWDDMKFLMAEIEQSAPPRS